MVRDKRSSCFAITIGPVDWSKSSLGDYLRNDNLCSRIAIGREPYHPPLDAESGEPSDQPVGFHHHMFIMTIEKFLLSEIRDILMTFIGDYQCSLNILTCRSPKAWLIYLSKEDQNPYLYNVRVSELSLYARCWHHAKTKYRYPQTAAGRTRCSGASVLPWRLSIHIAA